MKHIRTFFSVLFILGIVVIIYLPGCKKDKNDIQGPITPSGTASGDLGGNYPAPTVMKLQGKALSTSAPAQGQGLLWNNTTSQWEPTTLAGLGLWQAGGTGNVYSLQTGNLGIGTSVPTDEIHIVKDINSTVGLTLENKDTGPESIDRLSFVNANGLAAYIQFYNGSGNFPNFEFGNNRPTGSFVFNAGGSTRMILNSSGNVGIGTASPTQRLNVFGNICATGTIGACSDIRYKKNILSLTNALSAITSLHGIYYDWDKKKIDKDAYTKGRQIGFSAQEIEKYFPEIVQTDAKGYKAVDYGRLTPILTEAIKEQQQTIDRQRLLLDQQHSAINRIDKELLTMKLMIKELVKN